MIDCSDGKCAIDKTEEHVHSWGKYGFLRAAFSFVMLIAGIILSASGTGWFEPSSIRLVWYLIAYIPVALPVIIEAGEAILKKDVFSEFTLMSIATIGAFVIGEYPEGVAVMLFYAVGELFQESAVNRAKRNISALLDVRPETANVVRGENIETVSPEEVNIGDIVEVKAGERVPLDGTLLTQSVSFNTSALTGESVPRTILEGNEVLAGMIVMDKVTRIKVSKPFGESALARILELVQNAADRKAPAEQFIRKFSRIYTPIVVGLAALIILVPWLWSAINPSFIYDAYDWVYRGLVFLVISCPCALVISIPLSYFGGIGAASRKGILFKGSNYLEAITKVNTVVMDKTGTLTQGVFTVQEIDAVGMSDEALLLTVASVETQSNHPIAKAVVEYAENKGMQLSKPENVKEIAGHGLEATVAGMKVLAGNAKLLDSYDIKYPAEVKAIPETIVLSAVDGRYAGYIIVADAPKADAKEAIQSLKHLGVTKIVMLSGDKQAIVDKVSSDLAVDEGYGDLLPEGKVKHMETIKNDPANIVAFVGDGINDAPAITLSDVGIAMGSLGSDVAIETADVIIQTDQPSRIATAIKLGRITRRIVLQNISLAIGVKVIVLALGAFGVATLWEAVFADVGVSLIAILNAIRIFRIKVN